MSKTHTKSWKKDMRYVFLRLMKYQIIIQNVSNIILFLNKHIFDKLKI